MLTLCLMHLYVSVMTTVDMSNPFFGKSRNSLRRKADMFYDRILICEKVVKASLFSISNQNHILKVELSEFCFKSVSLGRSEYSWEVCYPCCCWLTWCVSSVDHEHNTSEQLYFALSFSGMDKQEEEHEQCSKVTLEDERKLYFSIKKVESDDDDGFIWRIILTDGCGVWQTEG